jgi:hypothetical protein
MCEAHDPPSPGENLLMMWKENPIPVEGDELNLDWGEYELVCVVEDALSAKVFNGEKRRLWLKVIDTKII